MGVVVPEGWSNATFMLKAPGSIRDKTFSIGFLNHILDPMTPAESATVINDIIKGTGKPFQSASFLAGWSYRGVSVMTLDGTLPIIGESGDGFVGAVAGEAPPSNCALLVRKNTASGGRHHRGRMYVPLCTVGEGAVDASGFFGTGDLATHASRWNNFFNDMVSAGLLPALFHSDETAPTAITGLSVESQLATQRRRMRQ